MRSPSIPRGIVWASLFALPWTASGPVRAATGISLNAALALAWIMTLLSASLFVRGRPAGDAGTTKRVFVATLIVAGGFVALLHNHYFRGVIMFSGIPDAAHHVASRRQFVATTPGIYGGAVSFFSFVSWIRSLTRINEYWAFLATFYFIVTMYFALALALASTVGRLRVFVPVLAVFALTTALPLFHYYHAEGFYPQLFALLALLWIWLVDRLVADVRIRWVLLCLLLLLYRYSYPLNLAELCVALAICALLDARANGPTYLRVALSGIAAALLAGAYLSYRRILQIYDIPGPFIPFDLAKIRVAEWLLVGVLAFRGSDRLRRLPLLFGLQSALFLTFAKVPARGVDYYFYKMNFHAVMLLVPAAAVATLDLIESLRAAKRTLRIVALVSLALGIAASSMMWWGFAPWHTTLKTRLFGKPPFSNVWPMADLDGWSRIEATLAREQKQFGGYVTGFYPLSDFMNESLGHPAGFDFYLGRGTPLREEAGYCVFWEWCVDPKNCLEPEYAGRMRRDRLMSQGGETCVGYRPSWNPEGIRTLCHRCY